MVDPVRAILLDVDGTLVDTTYGHTVAWWRALTGAGIDVSMARLHRLIGMGADQLLDEVVGGPRPDLEDRWSDAFEPFRAEARAIRGARDLLHALHDRGVVTVLATSGQPKDVEHLRSVIDAEAWIDDVVSSDEVNESKPAPDIFELAMEHVTAKPHQSIAVGDTVWDVQAAAAAHIACIGVLTGGIAACELLDAGAAAVYEDAADLLAHLDQSPLARLLDT